MKTKLEEELQELEKQEHEIRKRRLELYTQSFENPEKLKICSDKKAQEIIKMLEKEEKEYEEKPKNVFAKFTLQKEALQKAINLAKTRRSGAVKLAKYLNEHLKIHQNYKNQLTWDFKNLPDFWPQSGLLNPQENHAFDKSYRLLCELWPDLAQNIEKPHGK
jgi:hypothetical protein